MKTFAVYILASRRNGTLYTGMCSSLSRRIYEHREGLIAGFTRKYGIQTLVWYEHYDDMQEALLRERRIKRWQRSWKLNLIESSNPDWHDLYSEILHDL